MIPNPPNHLFSKCPVCNNKISEHSEFMVNKCYETLRGVLKK